ncbi:MAG TPA: outer membrane beta-barrel protein [Chitinophagaceae bacterium]|nr:outer membrane beta-barrel protein [Chitinophagaceae bacterium]
MKKIVLGVLFVSGLTFASRAQKGSILAYGAMGIRTENQPNDDKTTVFSVYPGMGYQFSKDWTAGVSGGFGRQKFNPETGSENKSDTYKVGGFARYTYTFNPIFSLYGQGDIYYHGKKAQDVTSDGVGIALTPAIGINISNNFALNVSFGNISYESIKVKGADKGIRTFDADFGNEIRIGVSKNFGGKK